MGNWFNQELFGRPTDVPWALEIDPEHRPDAFADVATFHPTFAYEALWNLALAGLLVWIERRHRLRPGQLFIGYVAGYAAGRLWVEALRVDPASDLWGLRGVLDDVTVTTVEPAPLTESSAHWAAEPGPAPTEDPSFWGSRSPVREIPLGGCWIPPTPIWCWALDRS